MKAYWADYIMGMMSKQGELSEAAEGSLYREGLEFPTRVKTGPITEDMPKKQTKPTVEASFNTMAEDRNYFS